MPSIYLLGGPMRVGKSITARRFGRATGISVISTDDIIEMLEQAAPDLGIGNEIDITWRENRRRVAPFIEAFARIRARDNHPILLEGEVLPDSVRKLLGELESEVRACFVGRCEGDVESVQSAIESYSATHGDWLAGSSKEKFREVAIDVYEASREFKAAATELGIPYFDMQPHFYACSQQVVRYLQGLS